MNLDKFIAESKSVLRRYLNTPMRDIPANDREKFNVAWIIVQAAIGRKKFDDFLKGIES